MDRIRPMGNVVWVAICGVFAKTRCPASFRLRRNSLLRIIVIKAVFRIVLICILWCGASTHARAATFTLFDDTAGTLPNTQSWLFYLPIGGSAAQTVVSTGVSLTTDKLVQAGYSNTFPVFNTLVNPAFPALDRTSGFSLDFELQILSEDHGTREDRAGFSVILLSSDNLGIEIGFWEDEIWEQRGPPDPLLTHGDGTNFDTTTSETEYSLQILNFEYSLFANNTPILSGPLRDYSSFGGPPYTLSNYLFIGDDTTSAEANIALGLVQLQTIPLPGSALLIFSGLAGFGFIKRRK